MKTIAKYLKPYILIILLSVVFLFARAWTDLTLPNLMSDIVNTGLQAGGIVEDAPDSISQDGMTLMTTFMTPADKATFMAAYTLDGDVYERNDFNDEAVGETYGRAAYAILTFASEAAQQSGADVTQEGESSTDGTEINLDIEAVYQYLPMLSQLPNETLTAYAKYDTDETTLSMQKQAGVTFTQAFYEELGIDVVKIQTDYIGKVGLYMLAITGMSVVAAILNGLLSSRVGSAFARDLRRAVFEKVESFSSKEFDKFSTASLLTRTTNDVTQMQQLVTMGLRMLLYAPIMGVGGVIMALRKSTTLSWIIAIGVVVLVLGVVLTFRSVVPKFTRLQEQTDKINLVARENLSGMLVIRAFGNEQYEEGRFNDANEDLTMTNRSVQRIIAVVQPLMTVLMNVVMVAIVWVGANAIANATMQVGDMMAFMQYAMHIIMSFLMISMMFIMMPRAAVSGRRIAEVLNSENLINDPEQPKTLDTGKKTRTVAFNDVTFRYGRAQEPVLTNISFTAKPGETTAIIGATGSGKSTLVNLIPRFYDVTKGSVTVDGVDIRDITMEQLRDEIGYVPQKGLLFSGTIEDNIKYGDENADEEQVEQALQVAQAWDFVSEYDDDVGHYISQGGTNVSGGQRQRLSIARALIKKAPIYIFDDSFSALDFKTDAALRKALRGYTDDATVIIVAQRVSTIMNAEQIIVLDDGEVVGIGTHKELLETCETYREIAESQLTKEEL